VAVGLEPIAAYDAREDKIFENIKIDTEKTIEELKVMALKAIAFAVKLAYPCKQTIGFLLAKAASHEKALSSLINQQNNQGGN
ncbi:MAG: hypothetical protein AABX71_00385, partial [Nanoarchaeota archaeon]